MAPLTQWLFYNSDLAVGGLVVIWSKIMPLCSKAKIPKLDPSVAMKGGK